jgi:hypothetical protein
MEWVADFTRIRSTEAMVINLNDYRWQRHCRGLFELPVAA